jgi:ribonuclease HI
MKPNVTIYTDGACSGNPGNGGWGAVLIYGGAEKQISGAQRDTTNNQMELLACIRALGLLKQPCKVDLYSDSAYVVNAFLLGWLENWKNNDWRTADKKRVKNVDYWVMLDKLATTHEITWHKVKGHADNKYNNICDRLAVSAYLDLVDE